MYIKNIPKNIVDFVMIMSVLSARERDLLIKRVKFNRTLESLKEDFGLSKPRLSKIENAAVLKLYSLLKEDI